MQLKRTYSLSFDESLMKSNVFAEHHVWKIGPGNYQNVARLTSRVLVVWWLSGHHATIADISWALVLYQLTW